MADTAKSLKDLKNLILSQYYDDDKWDINSKLLRAAGLFAGSIYLMRNFGDLLAI